MKYIKAIFYNYIFFIINALFFLIVIPIAIKVMEEEFFGLFSILNAILLFSNIGTLGMAKIINKYGSEEGENKIEFSELISHTSIILFLMALIGSITILLLRSFIANHISNNPITNQQIQIALIFTSISLFPLFLSRIPYGYLLSQLKNKYAISIDLFTIIFIWIGSIIISSFSKNLIYISINGLVLQTLNMIVLWIVILKSNKIKFIINSKTFRKILNFSSFSFLETLGIILFQQFDKILIGITIGPVGAGIYSVGTSIGTKISSLVGQATNIMIPYASKQESLKDFEKISFSYNKLLKFISVLIGIVGGLLCIWMEVILRIWISPEYSDANALFFKIIIIGYCFLSISRPAHQTLIGLGHIKFIAIGYFIISIIMLIILKILLVKYHILGASMSNLAMALLLIFNLYLTKIISGKYLTKQFFYSLSFGAIIPIICLLISEFQLSIADILLISFILILGAFSIIWNDNFFNESFYEIINNVNKKRQI